MYNMDMAISEIETMAKKRINLYGWTDAHEEALQVVYKKLRKQGFQVDRKGEPNVSQILLYLLEKEAREIKESGK